MSYCAFCKKCGTVPNGKLQTVIIGFYCEEDLLEAKNFFDVVKDVIGVRKVSRFVVSKESDNRARLTCEDVFAFYNLLDKEKVKFPKFLAVNLNKIPPIKMTDVGAISMLDSIVEVKPMINVPNTDINALKNSNAASAGVSISSLMTSVNTENKDETKLKRVFCYTGGAMTTSRIAIVRHK